VDLTDNDLIVDYSPAVPLPAVRSQIMTHSLFSSLADATHGLGYGENSVLGFTTFSGQSVDSTSLLVKYTYFGDADLDGDTDGVDIGTWAVNSTGELGGAGSMVWTQGDWDYDGDVDGVDAGRWAQAFTGELGGGGLGSIAFDAPISAGAAAILRNLGVNVLPEPSASALVAAAMLICAGRRRRQQL
jgi:hypothetical protein